MNVLCSELHKCNLSYKGEFKNFKTDNKIDIILNNIISYQNLSLLRQEENTSSPLV